MELISDLKEGCQTRRSIRETLRIFGANSKKEITQPLGNMPVEQAMTLVLNWLTLHAKNGHAVELRMFELQEQKAYATGLLLKNNAIYVQYVRDAPELINKILHYWDPSITYQTLSTKEIKNSVEYAYAINNLGDCDESKQGVGDMTNE